MTTLPALLADWNLEVIRDLLTKGYSESESFDFKEMLPRSSDDSGKLRLVKECCAFANGQGGFLLFGIADDKSKPIESRLVGIPPALDFPEQFGNYPRRCTPSVYWDFRNPPIGLASGAAIHVVHIAQSYDAPHAVKDAHDGWYFAKRTNKGVEAMSYEEVRLMYLGYYEKRVKLQLLDAELVAVAEEARGMIISPEQIESHYPLMTFDLRVLESVLSDTFTLLARRPELLALLRRLRSNCTAVNNKTGQFLGVSMLSFTNKAAMIREHNQYLRPICDQVVSLAEAARADLAEILAPKSP